MVDDALVARFKYLIFGEVPQVPLSIEWILQIESSLGLWKAQNNRPQVLVNIWWNKD